MSMKEILFWKQQVQFHPVSVEGTVTSQGGCNGTPAVILSGFGVADEKGRWTMDLSQAVCSLASEPVDGLPSFVATPVASDMPKPVIVTAAVNGLVIQVQCVDLTGSFVPNASFAWHCVYRSK